MEDIDVSGPKLLNMWRLQSTAVTLNVRDGQLVMYRFCHDRLDPASFPCFGQAAYTTKNTYFSERSTISLI